LRTDEVVGRQFLDLDIGLPVERLKGPIQECLSPGVDAREVTLPATNRVGKQIDCKVACMPLTGNDFRIRGVIMLMDVLAASG
jgi:two-component system CheB/CheR fusion protein